MANLKGVQSSRTDHASQLYCSADVAAGGVEYDYPGPAAHNRVAKGVQGLIGAKFTGDHKDWLLTWGGHRSVL